MLGRTAILHEIEQQRLVFSGALRGNSLLLCLGNTIQRFQHGQQIDPMTASFEKSHYYPKEASWIQCRIAPKETLLCSVAERILLKSPLGGLITTLSHVARLGLSAHCESSLVEPGFDGHLTLEISNRSGNEILLSQGMPFARLLVFRFEGTGVFTIASSYGEEQALISQYNLEFGQDKEVDR